MSRYSYWVRLAGSVLAFGLVFKGGLLTAKLMIARPLGMAKGHPWWPFLAVIGCLLGGQKATFWLPKRVLKDSKHGFGVSRQRVISAQR